LGPPSARSDQTAMM